METMTLRNPLDMHVHFREGQLLKQVVPLTAQQFSGALVMPNTSSPIMSLEALVAYRREIKEAFDSYPFNCYMTLYFSTKYTFEQLQAMRPFLTAIKFYSKGMTTNSQHGTDPDDPDILRVLEIMEILDIPLCVHGEAAGYWLFREQNFHQYWLMWARRYPKLRIIMEHISDARTASLLSEHENLYATITPHHLLLTTDDFCGDMLRPHLFCKPLMKTPEDRERLRSIALNLANNDRDKYASTKVMLGTDSAAHDEANKLKDCGCAGVMNAPIALQLLAEEFHKYSTVEDFQNFVSDNAQRIYYLSHLPDRTITLRREPFKIPEKYGNVVPMWAGQEIPWTILATV